MIEPVMMPYQYGPYLTASLLCVGLFIWSHITMSLFKGSFEQHKENFAEHLSSDEKNFDGLKSLMVSSIASQQQIAASISRVADALQHQAENQMQQMELLRETTQDSKVIMSSLSTSQQNLQRLLETMVTEIAAKR